ncbi:MAG TPA: polysaccharide biosynthesis protein [Vicinamibacterales bacterium]|jgi:FlaA1/EpsC-like NDP-sugar epimerase|nr:polysaccharide biosynthesis protein [Vicinamibacterales bacterium]
MMQVPLPDDVEAYGRIVTGRTDSFASADMSAHATALADGIRGRRLLVIGGAGSIGSAAVIRLARYGPECLHVVDHNENALVELVRTLRSGLALKRVDDFRTWSIDFGADEMRALISAQPRYDAVLNLAAIKHVRSEKDAISIMHLVNTNILKPRRLLEWMRRSGKGGCYFAVSTDKAAAPINLMGASKRLMEDVVLRLEPFDGDARRTTARFPNVAFSRGSLLDGFLNRLAKRQPLACPKDARRFFISLEESADICLLATFCADSGTITIPRDGVLSPSLMTDVVTKLLGHFGLEPVEYQDVESASAGLEGEVGRGRYPILLTALDTTGEKANEQFTAPGEIVEDMNWTSLVGLRPCPTDSALLLRCLDQLERFRHAGQIVDKTAVIETVLSVIPEFRHRETHRNLDMRA